MTAIQIKKLHQNLLMVFEITLFVNLFILYVPIVQSCCFFFGGGVLLFCFPFSSSLCLSTATYSFHHFSKLKSHIKDYHKFVYYCQNYNFFLYLDRILGASKGNGSSLLKALQSCTFFR